MIPWLAKSKFNKMKPKEYGNWKKIKKTYEHKVTNNQ